MLKYEYILVRYGEMTTKGKNRSKFVSTLKDNVKFKLKNSQILKSMQHMTVCTSN